jgi:sec-independent protein translocase protein TatA
MGDMPELPGIGEIVVIALIIFALFGYKRLPDAARSLGRSMRVFRAETRGLKEDDVRGKAEARVTTRGPLGDEEAASGPAAAQADAKPTATVVDAEPAAPAAEHAPDAEPAEQRAAGS